MIDTAYFIAVTLVFLRLIAFFVTVPIFFPTGIPNTFKVFFTLIISYIMVSTMDYSVIGNIPSDFPLIVAYINELITGIILGYITSLCFYFIQMAGSFMDIQIGLGMISMYDPNSKSTTTLLSKLIYFVAILIFFIVDGHHLLIKALVQSFEIVKIGKTMVFQDTLMATVEVFTKYFIIGLKIAIPIVLIIIITDLTMGLVSRTVPQLNIMILGLPVKLLVGISAFLIALPMITKIMTWSFLNILDVFKTVFKAIPLIIIFNSEDKTEEATPKKKSESRKKGQIARSKDVNIALTLLACTLVIANISEFVASNMKSDVLYYFSKSFKEEFTEFYIRDLTLTAMWSIAKTYLPIVIPIMVMGIVASLMQTGFLVTMEPLKPSLGKLNPLKGFKNMFSKRSFLDLGKNLIVVSLLTYIGYSFIIGNYEHIMQIGNLYMPTMGPEIKSLVLNIFSRITLILMVIAITDYVLQVRMHSKEMKMSKQEVKEEYKQMEGDPHIKGKIKQRQREMATRRMMQAIPDATVVITNPTHLAVAIKYEEGKMEAPKVVAKGADHLALKIKELAKENEVPVLENKPLARLIYEKVDLDKDIPVDMYQAVAEILAVVYKLKASSKK